MDHVRRDRIRLLQDHNPGAGSGPRPRPPRRPAAHRPPGGRGLARGSPRVGQVNDDYQRAAAFGPRAGFEAADQLLENRVLLIVGPKVYPVFAGVAVERGRARLPVRDTRGLVSYDAPVALY